MSDLVGNPEDRFSHNEAHMVMSSVIIIDVAFIIFILEAFWVQLLVLSKRCINYLSEARRRV